MLRTVILFVAVLLLAALPVEGRDWYYYNLDGSHIDMELCDSVVTVDLDSAYEGGKSPLTLMVPGLDPDYTPYQTNLGYWQYGVLPGYDIDTILADLRELDEVDYATPTFQLTDDQVWYVYNELLVTFNETTTQSQIDDLIAYYNLDVLREPLEWSPNYLLRQTEGSPHEIFDICNELFQTGHCQSAYPNIYGAPNPCFAPDDTYYDKQWYLSHTSLFTGKEGADIDMEAAWEFAKIDEGATVAIIDWGFDVNHEDIDSSRFLLAFDAAGEYVWDKIPDFDPDVPDSIFINYPYYWHGTACLGIVAAVTNNGQGVAGLADNLRIMPIKMIDDYVSSNSDVVSMAFQWAEYWGADIVLCALEQPIINPNVVKAIEYGYEVHGTATIVASGNKAKRPADISTLPTTFVVGGSDEWDNIWEYSNRGPGVDVLAPANKIAVTDITGEDGYNDGNLDADSCNMPLEYYCNFGNGRMWVGGVRHGTSAAAAQVAAIAGLVKSRSPHLTDGPERAEALYEVLRHSAEDQIHPDDAPGYDTLFGWGRVNAARALMAVVRGDANNDALINITDAVYLVNFIFGGGPEPQPELGVGDVNCDGLVNITDAVYLIQYIFNNGPAPKICFEYDYST